MGTEQVLIDSLRNRRKFLDRFNDLTFQRIQPAIARPLERGLLGGRHVPHPRVRAAPPHEFIVCATLRHGTALQNENLIAVDDGFETVRHEDDGACAAQLQQGANQMLLVARVKRARRLVED